MRKMMLDLNARLYFQSVIKIHLVVLRDRNSCGEHFYANKSRGNV